VMCDPYTPAGVPIPTNKRHNAAKIFRHQSLPPRSLGFSKDDRYMAGPIDINKKLLL
ncbi:unnamed protein product, partial [Arabidopsis lyrata]